MKTRVSLYGVLMMFTVAIAGCDGNVESARPKADVAKSVQPVSAAPGSIKVISAQAPVSTAGGDRFRTYDVRGQSQIQYAPKGQEITDAVKNVQVVVAARNTPYASIHANLLAKRLSKQFIVFCSACHDDYGNGVIGPALIGKNAQEVRKMMDKYSRDPNANVLMTDLMHNKKPAEIDFICEDIARFNREIQAETGSAQMR